MKYCGLALFLLSLTLTSCFKEKPIEPPVLDDEIKVISEEYEFGSFQYYDLSKRVITKRVTPESWDLAFSCDPNSAQILLNNYANVKGVNTKSKDFEAVYSEEEWRETMEFEPIKAYTSENGIGIFEAWGVVDPTNNFQRSRGDIYIIHNTALDKFFKIQILSKRDKGYHIQYAKLNNEDFRSVEIVIDETVNYIYYSLVNDNEQSFEPNKADWDIVLCRYTEIVNDNTGTPFEYQVNGFLTNQSSINVNRDSSEHFLDVSLDDVLYMNYSEQIDEIGFDWKQYDLNQQTYLTEVNINFIVKRISPTEEFYKIRFIDYQGGNPTSFSMELKEL